MICTRQISFKTSQLMSAMSKVTEGVSERGAGGGGGFRTRRRLSCFLAKERQLVQVVVSPYTYPTFVLSVAVVLLVVSR